MSFSYNAALTSDLDWVRFLIGDIVTPGHKLEDETITAMLADAVAQFGQGSWTPYFAASMCLRGMIQANAVGHLGKTSESVGSLSISYGGASEMDGNAGAGDKATSLWEEGCRRLMPRPKPFAVL